MTFVRRIIPVLRLQALTVVADILNGLQLLLILTRLLPSSAKPLFTTTFNILTFVESDGLHNLRPFTPFYPHT